MKRKILGIVTAFVMMLSVCSLTTINAEEVGSYATGAPEVAEADGKKYSTVKEAISNIQTAGTVKLIGDSEEASFEIPKGKNITLDLNAHTLTINTKDKYLLVNGSLTINGNGNLTRKDVGYLIDNKGSVVIENGNFSADDTLDTRKSSLIRNLGNMEIKNGTFTDKDIVIKNDDTNATSYGHLTISGGNFINKKVDTQEELFVVVQNSGEMNITGGTFVGAQNLIRSMVYAAPTKTTISGGIFNGNYNLLTNYFDKDGTASTAENIITGGIFNGKFDGGYYEENKNTIKGTININISGGTFTNDVTPWTDSNYSSVKVGDVYKIALKATGVTLSSDNALLAVGETTTLTATLAPAGTLDTATWKSSDEKIATVENGKVTAVAPGTAEITATVNGKTATCTVTVYKVETVTPPTVDTTKPVKEVTVGVNDKVSQDVISEVASSIINDIKAGNEVAGVDKQTADKLKEAADAGKTITTEVKVEKISADEVNKEAKATIIQLVSEETTGNKTSTIVEYLDLSILLKAGEEELGTVNELGTEVAFTVAIPEELVKEGRVFYVVRVHEGVAEKLPVTLNDDGTITFKTDKFSTYALVYEDGEATTPITPTDDKKEEIKSGVDTGDTTNTTALITLMGLAIVVAGGTLVSRKKLSK